MRKHSIWLIGVILLTVISFFTVFQPVTFSPRKDPTDASKYLRPVGTHGAWDPTTALQPATFKLGSQGMPVYVYTPQHDLSLGLDLRGGMRVVLEIANRGEFDYKLKTPLGPLDMSSKKAELIDAITKALGEGTASVELSETHAIITTKADTRLHAQDQLTKINAAMAEVFTVGNYTEPSSKGVFKEADAKTQDSVRNIMEKRINPDGTREITASAKGTNQVVLEIPGEKDPDHVREILGTTAEMNFMLLAQDIIVGEDKDGAVTLSRASGDVITDAEALKTAVLVVRGRDLDSNSDVTVDQQGKPAVSFSMRTQEAKNRFGAITGGNIGRKLAIVLDGTIISAPNIQDRINGSGIISGGFNDMKEAKDLAVLLNAGALPVDVKIVENRTVSATLGADSVQKSLIAGVIGLMAVLVFMIAYYRLPGIMASIALTIYIVLSLAVLKVFGSTLTLPGIAGIIIAIGMAVDANVIIFERLKEELRTQKPLESAIDVAFARAWTAILDSNVASIITGGVLYWLGTGAVRGFAVTLLIGVVVSMFTAVTVTRLFMKLMIRSKAGHKLAWYGV